MVTSVISGSIAVVTTSVVVSTVASVTGSFLCQGSQVDHRLRPHLTCLRVWQRVRRLRQEGLRRELREVVRRRVQGVRVRGERRRRGEQLGLALGLWYP